MVITSIAADRAARNRPWVGTHCVHNALVNNHFLDLLEVHGPRLAVVPDDAYPGYDPAGSHALRMKRLAREFRKQVIGAFARRIGFADVACVSPGSVTGPAKEEREKTETAMREGRPMIVGAVVADEERRLIGRIPILLRADVAEDLLNMKVNQDSKADMQGMYVAVGVKRRNVERNRSGTIRANSLGRVQAEMWLCNRLLASVQGRDPGAALLIGLHPKRKRAIHLGAFPRTSNADDEMDKRQPVFDDSVWRAARVPLDDPECPVGIAALEAVGWHVDVIDHGETWISTAVQRAGGNVKDGEEMLTLVATGTSDTRLRPNMKCASMYDAPWSKAKRKVAEALRELTLVSGVSHAIMSVAMAKGIPNDYSHHRVTAAALDVGSQYTKRTLEMCKASYNGPLVRPAVIPHNKFNWRRLQGFSKDDQLRFDKSDTELPYADERTFYVDFELASPEFLCNAERENEGERGRGEENEKRYGAFFEVSASMPIQQDTTTDALIFMIGCGQVVQGEWQHRVFTAPSLSVIGESSVIREWLEYMASVVPRDFGNPILNVWGPEQQLLRKSMRRMIAEDAEAVREKRFFKTVNVLQVVTSGCVTIKGNLSNSLKSVCGQLEEYGLLGEFKSRGTEEELVTNGADAMTLGLDCAEVVLREGLGLLGRAPKMKEIAKYNEADCRDIARVVSYLREHH